MTLLVDVLAGGYEPARGFVGAASSAPVEAIPPPAAAEVNQTETDQLNSDNGSAGFARAVTLADHTAHVLHEAAELCKALGVDAAEHDAIMRAARWHDLGKAHEEFQKTMRRGVRDKARYNGVLLAKSENPHLRHERPYFRHELASALAFLAHANWARDADLVAYLTAAHHGKVRLSLRALPAEQPPQGKQANARFARGIWEGHELPAVDLGGGEVFAGGPLTLSVMELGEDPVTRASWTERTRALLDQYGPFKLAWLEALLTIADWRASAGERKPGTPLDAADGGAPGVATGAASLQARNDGPQPGSGNDAND